jgi:hypothetical protein
VEVVGRNARAKKGLETSSDRTRWCFDIQDPQVFTSLDQHSASRPIPAEETNCRHVETLSTARRCAGAPDTSAALLPRRRGHEVLLRGIAQGHTGCWYDMPVFLCLYGVMKRRKDTES